MKILVHVSNNENMAFLCIEREEADDTEQPSAELLKRILTQKGIVYGIMESLLGRICLQKLYNQKILVAEGLMPQAGKHGRIQIKIKPKERPTYDRGIDADKKIDHYGEREGFITFIKEGTILASRVPPTHGRNGCTVTGRQINGILGKDVNLAMVRGRNTIIAGMDLIAAKDGVLKREKKKLNVDQNIELEQDLGMKTGSIVLPLESDIDLYIPGDIQSGFTAQSRKITVMGAVEDAKVTAKILQVRKGIVGISDKPIVADYLETGFIIGTRKIISRFVRVKKEISSGCQIRADFVRSHVIQECSITARYGVWTDYLYGYNKIRVGADIAKNEEYNTWIEKLEGVKRALEDIRITNHNALKKAISVKRMAAKMPNNRQVQKEFQRISEIIVKISKVQKVKEDLEEKIKRHGLNMYIAGSPFILVKYGFTKKARLEDRREPINDFMFKDVAYDKNRSFRSGLYILRDKEIVINSHHNPRELTALVEKYKAASLD